MTKELSEYSAETLLEMIDNGTTHEDDFLHRVQQCLIKRWRIGLDLAPLIRLLESELTKQRCRGAYYLGEVAQAVDGVLDAATKLSRDPLPQCRSVFVGYMTNSGFYNENIAIALARCLSDFNLDVRLETINWAVSTSDQRFDNFRELVESGTGIEFCEHWVRSLAKRSLQGLLIARRLRAGHAVAEIRTSMREVDSFTLDYLEAFEGRFQRYVEKRACAEGSAQKEEKGFEIGPVGEEYDRRGRMMTDPDSLPRDMPECVTDKQLDIMIARSKESIRQRAMDQRICT